MFSLGKNPKRNGDKDKYGCKGRATDNTFIERSFRTLKHKYVYLHPADDGLTLHIGIDRFIEKNNNKRRHQGIGRIKPVELFKLATRSFRV
jgi:putative transposase